MAGARPRGEQQQKPGVRASNDLMALRRGELDEQPRAAGDALAARARYLDLAVDQHDPRPLVDLVI
jgi:hypothetical protein